MSQGSLPGFDLAIPTDRLFLAVFPDTQHAAQLHALATKYLAGRRIGGDAVLPERLHVTLFHLGDYTELPPGLIEQSVQALSRTVAEPFTIRFDQAGSFNSRQSRGAFVFTGSGGNEVLHALHAQLALHLRSAALAEHARASFTPHLTMAYNKPAVPFEPIEPVTWPVHEVVLIHSLLGKTRHIRLAGKKLG
ncbi:RNA 2',3'-cyclic phosphodiesterase [Dyella mobilis]|uniref:RNA 2',3'-cyclic phosphodiesterase n=1 Tax=Dyella mobilis TaxID=1849582 RepID=A0ABS2KL01_9GAMM|nr:RNA 2',3'-cyclic phosphodiesterase [Dyella mobilis]MBM7131841.1 RNA 2',3'-cyclic phosphodiesterase [Dyella mobilis]GLQ96180.1 2'-5' RNA ligase [Dyella mobilis]